MIGIIALIAALIPRWVYKTDLELYDDYDDYTNEQYKVRSSISSIVGDARACFRNMSQNLREAKINLDSAEANFNEGAYSPFWDAIEKATSNLGHFSQNLAVLPSYLKAYIEWVPLYHGDPSEFPVTSEEFEKLHKIGTENALAKRLSGLVRNAQRDYHFASIFEQRKTHKLLVAGFENFADALNDVGNQISDNISYLESTVHTYNMEMTSLLGDAATQRERHHDELMETLNKDSEK